MFDPVVDLSDLTHRCTHDFCANDTSWRLAIATTSSRNSLGKAAGF